MLAITMCLLILSARRLVRLVAGGGGGGGVTVGFRQSVSDEGFGFRLWLLSMIVTWCIKVAKTASSRGELGSQSG